MRLISRLVKGENAVTLDQLAKIAEACGLQPWHLLWDDFDPKAPPDQPISEQDREMIRRLRRLLGPDINLPPN